MEYILRLECLLGFDIMFAVRNVLMKEIRKIMLVLCVLVSCFGRALLDSQFS